MKGEVSAVLDMMKEYLKKVLQARDTARQASKQIQLVDLYTCNLFIKKFFIAFFFSINYDHYK